jgi:hypothetical protein
MVTSLAGELYAQLYVRPAKPLSATPGSWEARRDFLASLSTANSGRGTWTPGWRIIRIDDDGDVAVWAHGLTFWASSTQVRPAGDAIEPGKTCWARVPKELRLLHPGCYFALGDTPDGYLHTDPGGGPHPLVRYFWNLPARTAAGFLREATTTLNALAVPFRLKLLSDPAAYHRADAAVLYLRREDALAHTEAIERIYQTVAAGLRPAIPLLTYRLAAGLSLAEDPGDDSSFGLHRCTLIAQAFWQSFLRGEVELDARAAILVDIVLQHGLDPRHPYLAPGSTLDDLRPAFVRIPPAAVVVQAEPTALSGSDAAPFAPLEAAVIAGRTICRSAVWDRDRRYCNWIAYSAIDDAFADPTRPVPAALGPDLYSGSAGVALFLAELHALTGDADFRETARCAMARALRQAHLRPRDLASPLSLFHGLAGLALAASRAGRLLGEPELCAEAARIVERIHALRESPHLLDLLSGSAGAIIALLDLARFSACDAERNVAVVLGDELCGAAERRGAMRFWNPERASGPQVASAPLTGLSHGAAGFALALLSLYQATGTARFLEAAREAFAYEDSQFDPRAGNWPDLRDSHDVSETRETTRFAGGWCHGAPGIALARLRAASIDRENADSHRTVARAAIATALQIADRAIANPASDLSLCHGLAGLLDILLIAGRKLGDPACLELAERAGRTLIPRQGLAVESPSVCANPSLMLGMAGTGYALLRLHAPDRVPSILLLGEPAEEGTHAPTPSQPQSLGVGAPR